MTVHGTPAGGTHRSIGGGVDPKDIFELIVKADEKLKYATAAKADTRAVQARELLDQARTEASAIGHRALVEQAEQRLADLDALQAGSEPEAGG